MYPLPRFKSLNCNNSNRSQLFGTRVSNLCLVVEVDIFKHVQLHLNFIHTVSSKARSAFVLTVRYLINKYTIKHIDVLTLPVTWCQCERSVSRNLASFKTNSYSVFVCKRWHLLFLLIALYFVVVLLRIGRSSSWAKIIWKKGCRVWLGGGGGAMLQTRRSTCFCAPGERCSAHDWVTASWISSTKETVFFGPTAWVAPLYFLSKKGLNINGFFWLAALSKLYGCAKSVKKIGQSLRLQVQIHTIYRMIVWFLTNIQNKDPVLSKI